MEGHERRTITKRFSEVIFAQVIPHYVKVRMFKFKKERKDV